MREERGLNTVSCHLHCSEAGNVDHLASTFLLAHGINHGLLLKQTQVLQYLFYICQIGINVIIIK